MFFYCIVYGVFGFVFVGVVFIFVMSGIFKYFFKVMFYFFFFYIECFEIFDIWSVDDVFVVVYWEYFGKGCGMYFFVMVIGYFICF